MLTIKREQQQQQKSDLLPAFVKCTCTQTNQLPIYLRELCNYFFAISNEWERKTINKVSIWQESWLWIKFNYGNASVHDLLQRRALILEDNDFAAFNSLKNSPWFLLFSLSQNHSKMHLACWNAADFLIFFLFSLFCTFWEPSGLDSKAAAACTLHI
jgi:hypothetical protein